MERIAHILGTLDDKIELNRRMNETLEAMARALFKSWFVDFDPVHAKADAKRHGTSPDAALAKLGVTPAVSPLFPDSFTDSPLGPIPTGWEVGCLCDIVAQRTERVFPSRETERLPYVPIDCISSRSLFLSESKPGCEAQSSLIRFYRHDILFGAMRPYFHKVCIAPFEGTTRTTAFVLTPRRPDLFAYAVLTIHDEDTIDYATRHSTGSTIPYAKWNDSLERREIVMPPDPVLIDFNRIIKPLLDRIPLAFYESKSLAESRDALLPVLLSSGVDNETLFCGENS